MIRSDELLNSKDGRFATGAERPILNPSTIYPEKNSAPFPASTTHRQHPRSTWSTSTDMPRTSQSTKQNWLSYSLIRHDDGPQPRERRHGTGAGLWRGRGALGFCGCSLCPCLHVTSMHACTSVEQQQHGGLRLPRSMFRGLSLFQVGCRVCLKRELGHTLLG